MLETASPTASQPTALSWLTNWVNQPIEMAPGFDPEEIKPSPAPPTVAPRNLLEVTVWDLYEPGKPYSFPVRVTEAYQIEVPMLGEVSVENRTIPQVESALVDRYRRGEYLLNPRVLVRSLEAQVVKVHVTGAVNRPGYVELTRADRSVYAAVLSAGGLNKSAGTQLAVTRAAPVPVSETPVQQRAASPSANDHLTPSAGTSDDDAGDATPEQVWREPHEPTQRANSVEDLSVSPGPAVVRPAGQMPGQRGLYSVFDNGFTGAAETAPAASDRFEFCTQYKVPPQSSANEFQDSAARVCSIEPVTVWYDVSLARDRDQLKAIVLSEGDTVTVKAAAQPLRIGGIVNRPGAYPLPPGRSLNAWQAIELAGGIRDEQVPLNITLRRPAADGHRERHWFLSVTSYDQHPTTSPLVEPGDELHVQPTTGSKIKRAVRDVWSKP
ncbi:MAG: SLBB domain-containing protein [Planctomycetia bacterium]|nr:SLBB domain-containing protein [Planctomycetia bacterium]